MQDNRVSAKSRFSQLSPKREPFLTRGRACAEVTIPALCPPAGVDGSSVFSTPYQAVGSQGVGSLASQLLTTMLPANESFFRFSADIEDLEKYKITPTEADQGLAALEQAITDEIESKSMRVPVFEALKQLIVVGNSLLYLTPKDGLKVYRLDRYVVRRDPMGNVLEIIVKESIHPSALPIEVREEIQKRIEAASEEFDMEADVDLYTYIKRKSNGTWETFQEAADVEIKSTKATYPKDKCPWLPLRLMAVDGEDYGRSFTEEYLGDLKTTETLSKALIEGSVAAARVLFLVKPNGTTRARTLEELPNGGIGQGDANDVSVLQMQKQADFGVVRQVLDDLTRRLETIFMMHSSVQRKGERVTAEEIRYMASQLERNLGGVYSLLAASFQLPLVNLILLSLQKQRKLPSLPKGLVKPKITTGMSALGRNSDFQKLVAYRQEMTQAAPLSQLAGFNMNEYEMRVATALGVQPEGLIQTPQQVQQTQQQNMQQQIMAQATPQIIQAATQMMNKQQGK